MTDSDAPHPLTSAIFWPPLVRLKIHVKATWRLLIELLVES